MPTYSNSRLNKFEECPRAYKFKYIQEIEVERVRNIYAFLGNRVHETLEHLHKNLKDENFCSLEDLFEFYENIWKEEWSDDIEIYGKDSPKRFREVGKKCIENYYEKHKPFNDETIDTELIIHPKVGVDDHEYTFLGYIDRLALINGNKYEIHDYKTSKNVPNKEDLENNRQLPLYQLGVQQEYSNAENIELVWHYVRFGKDFRISHSQEKIDKIKREVVKEIKEIEEAKEKDDFPTMKNRGANCNWCDFQNICPDWK